MLGGTRYVGRKLVAKLVQDNIQVTVATRGNRPALPAGYVENIRFDRTSLLSMREAFGKRTWDVVYDQVCYSPADAADACSVFSGRVGRYIFTSSVAVYPAGRGHKECSFNPWEQPLLFARRESLSYSLGKRLAEAWFLQNARFPVVAVRLPFVFGPQDRGGLLDCCVRRMRANKTIMVENSDAVTSIVSSEEAADFLFWQRDRAFVGPVNACFTGEVSIGEISDAISSALDFRVTVQCLVDQSTMDPFNVHTTWENNEKVLPYSIWADWSMDPTCAMRDGYLFSQARECFSHLISEATASLLPGSSAC